MKSIIIGKTSPKIVRIVPMCASFRVPIGWSCVIFSAGMKETSPQCSAGEQCSKVKQLVIFSRSHPSSTYVYVYIYIYTLSSFKLYIIVDRDRHIQLNNTKQLYTSIGRQTDRQTDR